VNRLGTFGHAVAATVAQVIVVSADNDNFVRQGAGAFQYADDILDIDHAIAIDGDMGASPWRFTAQSDGADLHALIPLCPELHFVGEATAVVVERLG
jgi:hypothetical protein